jgi:acetyl-CoA carboxylase biotin carboxyl carrier protein
MAVLLLDNTKENKMKLTIENIRFLANMMTTDQLSSIEIEESNFKIKIKREKCNQNNDTVKIDLSDSIDQQSIPLTSTTPTETTPLLKNDDFIEIKSPMVGVYYQSSQPDAQPYLTIGQPFAQGDTLCIIEAMKLMNEITADTSGTIMEICVENGQVVEFGQVLFRIKKGN